MPKLTVTRETWPLREAFTISRGSRTEAEVVVAEIRDGDRVGRGECVPYRRYGETIDVVVAKIESFADAIAAGHDRAALQQQCAPGAARNALDCALWDLDAKRSGRRVWELCGMAEPVPTLTVETVSLDTPDAMREAARRRATRPILKVKLDGEQIVDRVAAVRDGSPDARLVVDANEAWTAEQLRTVAPELQGLGVEMIEQPLPADDDDALADWRSPIPLCADEACHVTGDLDRLVGRYGMVNIKLDKTGGLSEALALLHAARERGLSVMVGCMVSTSLAMAPATLLAPQAEVVDLDGPLWLVADRDHGLDYADSRVHAPAPELWG